MAIADTERCLRCCSLNHRKLHDSTPYFIFPTPLSFSQGARVMHKFSEPCSVDIQITNTRESG